MAGSVLVDTNVVVAYFRGDKVLEPRFAGSTPANFTLAHKGHSGGWSSSHTTTCRA
jgi:hypothetical protein